MENNNHSKTVGLSRAIIAYGGTMKFITAEWLTRISVRPPHVADLTGIPEGRAVAMWAEIHGERPPRGQLPEFAANLLQTREKSVHGSLFAYYYFLEGGNKIYENQIANAIIAAYIAYIKKVDKVIVSGEAAFMISRDLVKKSVLNSEKKNSNMELCVCQECFAYHVKSDIRRSTEDCPFCAIASVGF
jgi:hypothetical protein